MADIGNHWAQGILEIPFLGLPVSLFRLPFVVGAVVEMSKETIVKQSFIKKITLFLVGQPAVVKLVQLGDGVFTGYKAGDTLSFVVHFQLIISIQGYDAVSMAPDTITGKAFLKNNAVIMNLPPTFLDRFGAALRKIKRTPISALEGRGFPGN